MRWPVLDVLQYLRNMTLRAAHMNVVIGKRMEAKVVAQGVPLERVCVIPNWADGALIIPVPREENSLRKLWNLEEKFVVGYSGNLGRAHEFSSILDAAEVLRHRQDIVFVFIGGGAQRSAVEQEVHVRDLSAVLFKPYQPREQLSESLSAVDLHLISLNPALEGLIVPSKFYGIAAAGRPSIFIGDSAGEIPCLLQEYTCGYSVSSDDTVELVDKILDFANNPSSCKKQGVGARLTFIERFDRIVALTAFEKTLLKV